MGVFGRRSAHPSQRAEDGQRGTSRGKPRPYVAVGRCRATPRVACPLPVRVLTIPRPHAPPSSRSCAVALALRLALGAARSPTSGSRATSRGAPSESRAAAAEPRRALRERRRRLLRERQHRVREPRLHRLARRSRVRATRPAGTARSRASRTRTARVRDRARVPADGARPALPRSARPLDPELQASGTSATSRSRATAASRGDACARWRRARSRPARCTARRSAPERRRPRAPRVVVETAAGARHAVAVELARTDAERARGLMGRDARSRPTRGCCSSSTRPRDHALLDEEHPHPARHDLHRRRRAGSSGSSRARRRATSRRAPSGAPSRYVLEVNGGWAAARGVRAGDRVRFENVPRF